MRNNNAIAFFDFDGTITIKDSLSDFLQYGVGKSAYYISLLKLSPMLISYKLKIIPNYIAKERLVSHLLKGWEVDRFEKLSSQYSLELIDKITRPKAIEKIQWHQDQAHKVVIVSASMECWLKDWCDKNKLDLIATRLEIKYGKLTGKFSTRNCYGIEKVRRVKEAYDLRQYDCVYAYGDSRGDKELLALADEAFYRPFRN